MVLALVVAGVTGVGGGQALASHVGCGDTITTDTTLDSDLVNCPNNGIIRPRDRADLDVRQRDQRARAHVEPYRPMDGISSTDAEAA